MDALAHEELIDESDPGDQDADDAYDAEIMYNDKFAADALIAYEEVGA